MVVVGILVTAFITGALARFALPGPDPMPVWLTIAIGPSCGTASRNIVEKLSTAPLPKFASP